jgi:hypothetical protein
MIKNEVDDDDFSRIAETNTDLSYPLIIITGD